MLTLVTPDEMRAAEARAAAGGRPEPVLMRLAADRIADWIDRYVKRRAEARRFAVAIVGPGNNGGDALVALAILVDRGWRCAAVYAGHRNENNLPVANELLAQIEAVGVDSLDDADIVLDGVYGIGSRASLPDTVASVFRRAYTIRIERGTPLVAIDVPSGVDANTGAAADDAFRADTTLCIGLPKIGLISEPAASHVGELELLDIGIESPPALNRPEMIDELSIRRLMPRRGASAHKHQTGTTLVIGGAPTYYGAPRLCAESAARAGAGLVCVASPATIVPVIAGQVPEVTFLPLGDSPSVSAVQIESWITDRNGHVDAIVIGPGLGQSEEVTELLERLFTSTDGIFNTSSSGEASRPPLILDADALNWIAKRGVFPKTIMDGTAVLTPHAGELARLLHVSIADILRAPIDAAKHASELFKQVVLLKSGFSAIASPSSGVYVAPRSAPELATAGTGDVLAGLIGGLAAQGLTPTEAAVAGLFIGSQAGRLARQQRGLFGVLAHDVIQLIPEVMRRLVDPRLAGGDMNKDREEL